MTASGGQTVGDSVRRITRKIGTASLWSNFNMKGRKKKCSFEKLPLYNMIISRFSVHSVKTAIIILLPIYVNDLQIHLCI